jgi:hypothetical protein
MRILLWGAVTACVWAAPAAAFDPPNIWIGQMAFLSLTGCGGGASDSVAVVFRPKLEAGEENSTLTYFFSFASGTVQKQDPGLQFNGSGRYDGTFVTGRATLRSNQGRFDLTVTPSVVTPGTDVISFTGSFTNFAGVKGCSAAVRGSAVRHP